MKQFANHYGGGNEVSGRLVKAEILTPTTSKLFLDNGFEVPVWGQVKNLRIMYHNDLPGVYVTCNRHLRMTPENWEKIQPILTEYDFSPALNERLKLSYQELDELPRWLWTCDQGRLKKHQRRVLFLYHPINFWKSSYDPDNPDEPVIKCCLRDFKDGKTYRWHTAVNLETKKLQVYPEVLDHVEFLV
jgi:hypothetical protein